ncbi:MAG: FadR/GntR family transcriptional regulator [Desulfohalobiaceae bacterium]
MFQNVSHGKRSVFIINEIRESILKGRLKPGDRLPSEHNLMNQFGVSRFTLREALLSLETMGFIEVRKGAGGGPVVKQVTMNVAREAISHFLHFQDVSIGDLSEVRKLVEPYLASQMADKLSDEDIEYLESLNEACSRTLDRGEEIIGGEQEIDFHIHLARATGNSVLIMIMDFVNKLLAESKLSVKPGPEFSRRVVQAHQRIIDALKSRDGEAAAQAMYDHVAEVEEEMHKLRASQP